MNISIRFHKQWYLILLLVIVFSGCVKKEFEAPEIKEPSELPPPTPSLAESLAMHTIVNNALTAICD